jgi:hypothetical protein
VTFTVGPISTIPSTGYTPPHTLTEAELTDLDDDGFADVAWVFATTSGTMPVHDIESMPGAGDGSFSNSYGGGAFTSVVSPPMTSGDVLGVGAEGSAFATQNAAGSIAVRTDGTRFMGMSRFHVGGAVFTTGALAGLTVGDLDGDSIDDVIVADSAGLRVVSFLSQGETGLDAGQGTALPVGTVPAGLAAGRFRGSFNQDLVVALGTAGFVLMTSDGTGLFTAGTVVPLGSGRFFRDLAAGDFNGDGLEDVAGVVAQAGQPTVLAVLLSQGSGAFGPLIPTALEPALGAAALTHVHVADVNGDGRDDLLCVAPALDRTLVALSDGVGGLVLATDPDLQGGGHATLSVGDVDHDGDLDILVGNSATLTVRTLLNDSL